MRLTHLALLELLKVKEKEVFKMKHIGVDYNEFYARFSGNVIEWYERNRGFVPLDIGLNELCDYEITIDFNARVKEVEEPTHETD